jgi:hypothetical protein
MRLSNLGEVVIRLAREKVWGLSGAIGHVPCLAYSYVITFVDLPERNRKSLRAEIGLGKDR